MKRKVLTLIILISCSVCANAFSADWDISKLTDNSYTDQLPRANDSGDVVWQGYVDAYGDIFFYDHSLKTTTRLTNDPYSDGQQRINANGDIAWQGGSDRDIFLYDNSAKTTSNLSNTPFGPYAEESPFINDNTDVMWRGQQQWYYYDHANNSTTTFPGSRIQGFDYSDTNSQIAKNGITAQNSGGTLYWSNGINTTGLGTIYDAFGLSDNGKAAWSGPGGIYAFDGATKKLIYDTSYTQNRPDINDDGNIVWQGRDANGVQQIYMYTLSTGEIIQLSNSPKYGNLPFMQAANLYPQINNSGEVFWQGYDGTDYEIYRASANVVPEPATMFLLPLGLAGLRFLKRKKA